MHNGTRIRLEERLLPASGFILLALVVLGPLLAPGYLLLLDAPAGPHEVWETPFPAPSEGLVTSAVPALNTMRALALLSPQLPNKLVIAATVFLGGYGAYRYLRRELGLGSWAAATGGTLLVINPWMYERVLAGQILLTLSVAVIPWALPSLTRMTMEAHTSDFLHALGWVAAVALIDIHGGAMALLLLGTVIVFSPTPTARKALLLILGALAFAVVNLYWMVPSLLAGEPGRLGLGDYLAYSPRPRSASILPHVFMLHGFWRLEFPTPLQDNGSMFLLPFLALAAAAALGLILAIGLEQYRRASIALAVACLVAAILGMGRSFPLTEPIARFMFERVPGYGIFREPQKWIALLAVGYCVFAAVGVQLLADALGRLHRAAPHVMAFGIALPLVATSNMLWGLGGHASLSDFPEGWQRVEQMTQGSEGSILAMPWNQYQPMRLTDGRFVANPAPHYFSSDVLVSGDPRLFVRNQTEPSDPRDRYVEALIRSRARLERMGTMLVPMAVRWVVLVHDADWRFYRFLNRQEDLDVVYEDRDITLYENESYSGDTYRLRNGRTAPDLAEALRGDPEESIEELILLDDSRRTGNGVPGPDLERSWPWWEEIDALDSPYVGTSQSCLDGWHLGDDAALCHLGAFAAFPSSEGQDLWRTGVLLQSLAIAISVAGLIGLALAIRAGKRTNRGRSGGSDEPGPSHR